MNPSHAKVSSAPPEQRSEIPSAQEQNDSSDARDGEQSDVRIVLFLLNRNGLDDVDLISVFETMLETQYDAKGVYVRWLSIFGKMPERPHALITLSDDDVSRRLLEEDVITFDLNDKDYRFELSQASGMEAGHDDDAYSIFINNVPNVNPNGIDRRLRTFFDDIATVEDVIFPREWIKSRTVILRFSTPEAAGLVARCAKFCIFEGETMSCRFARKQIPRSSPPKNRK